MEIKDNTVNILFDYLDKNQGGIFKIVHSGKSSSNIEIQGTIKGVGGIKEYSHSSLVRFFSSSSGTEREKESLRKSAPFFILQMGIFLMAASYFIIAQKEDTNILLYLFLIVGVLIVITGLILAFNNVTLPEDFDIIYDDE